MNTVEPNAFHRPEQKNLKALPIDLTGSEPHQHILTRAQLGHAEPAQGLHVDEDVRLPLTHGEEAEAAQAVEPFDLRPLRRRSQIAGSREQLTCGAGNRLRPRSTPETLRF